MMMRFPVLAALSLASVVSEAAEVPRFIDPADLQNPTFVCLNEPVTYDDEERRYVDLLWQETLSYLQGYAEGLTAATGPGCGDSALAMTETNDPTLSGPKYQCIMDNPDMQRMVKEIHQVLANPDQARQCFSARKGASGLMLPDEALLEVSEVARWLQRPTMKAYYAGLEDQQLSASGQRFSEHFREAVSGQAMRMPTGFTRDLSANALPNLWASAGWVPMYSKSDHRSLTAGDHNFRGGYAYAEVFGPWGLLQIASINGQRVEAEIGMTAQAMDSFYPYHFHIAQEIYHTIREPQCANQVNQFVVTANNAVLAHEGDTDQHRILRFDGANTANVDHYWVSTTTMRDPLLYIPTNAIHAFDLGDCELDDDAVNAHVALWARSIVPNYGGTTLCELTDADLPKSAINRRDADVRCKPVHKRFK
ncbi:dimethylsulfonioproprionate lyase family protein [Ferrimonas balearica]|uniref:dimethylsulfonioproprionate lyase family protein n=1 Tax=Ferrimonas balearica TaxID=44012 RepID=UPI001C55B168|nr:dimethylsulfonioproprionate lyase family protein [Ferrimonas balearica]MBW3163276.1 hypothetical protein [Ferrimonas balearica]